MKKPLVFFAVFAGLIIVLWAVGKMTGAFQIYKTSSGSMEPTIKAKSHFYVSTLIKPKRNSIIAFDRVTTEKDGFVSPGKKLAYVSRLVAFGGETIHIKNGLAYVNGNLVDDTTKLKFRYLFNMADRQKVADIFKDDFDDMVSYSTGNFSETDLFFLTLSYEDLKRVQNVTIPIRDTTEDFAPELLYNNDNIKNWTVNNYGPMKIPANCYFILGDNRNQSSDSRFNGSVPERDWVGTVIWKK